MKKEKIENITHHNESMMFRCMLRTRQSTKHILCFCTSSLFREVCRKLELCRHLRASCPMVVDVTQGGHPVFMHLSIPREPESGGPFVFGI